MMMSSSHLPPCEIQSDRSITMFSKNTPRVFRRRRREKKVSVASEETEREKETFERRRAKKLFSRRPPPKEPKAPGWKNSIPILEKETSFVFDDLQSSTRKSRRRRLQSQKREKRRRASSSSSSTDAYLQKKTPTPSSSREDAWEKHVFVCSLSLCVSASKVLLQNSMTFLSPFCKKKTTLHTPPLNPTSIMFRVLVV